jgi:hypothetical protein
VIRGHLSWKWDVNARDWYLCPLELPQAIRVTRTIEPQSQPSANEEDDPTINGIEGPAELRHGLDMTIVPYEFVRAVHGLTPGMPVEVISADGQECEEYPTYMVSIHLPSIGTLSTRVRPGQVEKVLIGNDILGQLFFILNGPKMRWVLARGSILDRIQTALYLLTPASDVRKPVAPGPS